MSGSYFVVEGTGPVARTTGPGVMVGVKPEESKTLRTKLILYVICITIRDKNTMKNNFRSHGLTLDTQPLPSFNRTGARVCAPRAVRFVHHDTIDANAAPTECNVNEDGDTINLCIV